MNAYYRRNPGYQEDFRFILRANHARQGSSCSPARLDPRKHALKGQEHIKSDERIPGDSDFVADVLSQADEKFDRKCELKRLGYDQGRIAARVAEIYELREDDILSKGKQQRKVKARCLLCFWAVRELGSSLTDLAKHFGLSVPGIGYSVERGEIIARENGYRLVQ